MTLFQQLKCNNSVVKTPICYNNSNIKQLTLNFSTIKREVKTKQVLKKT